MTTDLSKKILEEYCSQCKKGAIKGISDSNDNTNVIIRVLYRIYALEKADKLGESEFINNCIEKCPYKKTSGPTSLMK